MTRKMPPHRVDLVRKLRREMTTSERVLWDGLRGGRLRGWKFRRQRLIGSFIADFCCDELKLVVEVDGSVHDEPDRREYDRAREQFLTEQGFTVLRFRTEQVQSDLETVLRVIMGAADSLAPPPHPTADSSSASGRPPHPPAPSPTRGEGE